MSANLIKFPYCKKCENTKKVMEHFSDGGHGEELEVVCPDCKPQDVIKSKSNSESNGEKTFECIY